jgi:coproporphyrinogen III oxidase
MTTVAAAMPDVEDRKRQATAWFAALRDRICTAFEAIEDAYVAQRPDAAPAGRFERLPWDRPEGGGGVISLMHGRVFEKVGVNISTVFGEFSPEFRGQIPGAAEDPRFWASGISLVAHLRSPLVPAVHMNTRHIVTTKAWFGGGADLTPMVPDAEDTRDFHAALKAACDTHDPAYYPRFKAWCDEYFFLKHRNEPRGVGGIFFDDYFEDGFERSFGLLRAVGDAFLAAYLPILQRRKGMAYGERERAWQLLRRGRYVEFNLVWDRGTHFGLQSGGRTESILMSMPPQASWAYQQQPEPGTPEAELLQRFVVRRDWL